MGPRVNSEQRRAELIAVALRQYAQHGVDATTRSSLAAELGVDRVIVHRLYPDLDDLFDDVVDHVRALGTQVITDAASMVDGLEPGAEIWQPLIELILRSARDHPDEWQFLFVVATPAGAARRLAEMRTEVARRVIGEFVARAQPGSAGGVEQEVEWAAGFLYHGLQGSIAEHLASGRVRDDPLFAEHLGRIVEGMVGQPVTANRSAADGIAGD